MSEAPVLLVTGGSRGIGASVCRLAGAAGWQVAVNYASNLDAAEAVVADIRALGGSAVAGIHRCWAQSAGDTPDIRHINPMVDIGFDYRRDWKEVSGLAVYTNPYRVGWERFLRHIVVGEPLASDLSAGIRDVTLVEACYRSAAEGRWIALDEA